jgi:predicted Rossmann fold nucleotide-binding protein DprA/Smf involved in DNA uptake
MDIGFTGSRKGMSEKQKRTFKQLLKNLGAPDCVLRHGDCVGADADANDIATNLDVLRIIHPPKDNKARAHCIVDRTFPPQEYLTRNRHIVDACDVLIAAPDSKEKRRSGTWSTVRYARKKNKRVIIIKPS